MEDEGSAVNLGALVATRREKLVELEGLEPSTSSMPPNL